LQIAYLVDQFTLSINQITIMAQHMKHMAHLGAILLIATLTALVTVALVRFPGHLAEVDWPPHAKSHLIGQIGTIVALATLSVAVLAGPFRSGKLWAWWCLTLVGLAVFGGYWLAVAMVEPDAPWRGGNTTFAVLTGGYASGLVLSWHSFFGSKR